MNKAELERTKVELERKLLIDTKNLLLQSMEAIEEFEKMKKSTDLIGWVGLILMFAVGFLVIIALLTVIFFLC